MVIKKVNIIAFGGLQNKIIEFCGGINVIYGENEAGKSTIQAFIKIWLYGFSNLRGKDLKTNERLRYVPLCGGKIRGELYVEFDNKTYIIKRTFGKTKKEDTSTIINSLTGEEVNDINRDEPGKDFLSINRSTFSKTLFIGQLGSEINKDKDEEILDKILNSVGVGEGDVTVDRAFTKLENYKKYLINTRKTGYLDKLKEKYSLLVSERYESYNLSEQNLDNEEALIKLKKEREDINGELSNLEIYKKYLKKVKLQKEYEGLTNYLRKKEELEEKEKTIDNSLSYKNEVISLSTIDVLKEDYSMYLSLLDLKKEDEAKLNEKLEALQKVEEPIRKYKYIESLDKDISQQLIKLKVEQDALTEKIEINKKIDTEIELLISKEKSAKEYIGNAYKLKDIKDEVTEELDRYEDKLKTLKYSMENRKNNNIFTKNHMRITLLIIMVMTAILSFYIENLIVKVSLLTISILSGITLIFGNYIISLKEKRNIKSLKEDISKIELNLEYYNKETGVTDFGQLIRSLKLYNDYLLLKEKVDIKIKEKNSQKELLSLEEANNKFNKNKEKIKEYLDISNLNSLDELISDIYKYEEINKNYSSLRSDVKSAEEAMKRLEEQIDIRKETITERLSNIGLENINILELGERLKEIKDKITEREEVHRSLLSIEETYSVLTKDKDIESIKDELKEIINISFKFSYEKEEEIDDAVKAKSSRLLQVEKDIKDLENKIDNIFKGKRRISEIESEVINVESDISEEEKNLKAAEIAREVLSKAYDGLRDDFGPLLNNKVMTLFREFTDNRYTDVLVSDKYEMQVVKNNDILSSKLLSNGANDQLYLALRIAFIEMIFKSKNVALYLDDAFTQYDDNRVSNILEYLAFEDFTQLLIFTCQKREELYLKEKNMKHNYIYL